MTEARTEQPTCIMGRSTGEPCGRPATEPIPRYGDEGLELCAFHAALEPLYQEAEDLSAALALFKEWRKEARKYGNQPLLGLLDRVRAEFSERLKLLDQSAEALEGAEKYAAPMVCNR
jgi:hypothetical protein